MTVQPLTRLATRHLAAGFRRQHPLLTLALVRVFYGVATLLVVSFLIFWATNVLPGNVAEIVMGKQANPAAVTALEKSLGLNDPFFVRYFNWLTGLLHGDLGNSAVSLAQSSANPGIAHQITDPLWNSVVLAAVAVVLLVPLSLLVGVYSAVRQGRPADQVVSYVTLIFGCLPEFVLGTLLVLVFSTRLGWLPPVDLLPPGQSPLSDLAALTLPVLTLLGVALAFTARQVRASMAVTLREEYVLMARLNGLRERRVLFRYALRNALPSTVQSFAQAIQYLFGGVIVVETVYSYPGIGSLLVQAVSRRDTTMVAAIALILAAAYIAINILADLAVAVLVPKLRTGGGHR